MIPLGRFGAPEFYDARKNQSPQTSTPNNIQRQQQHVQCNITMQTIDEDDGLREDDNRGDVGSPQQQAASSFAAKELEIPFPPLPRLIQRNLPFSQSRNRVRMMHNQGFAIYKLLRHDWFHVTLRFSTGRSLLFMLSLWTILLIVFAGLYVWLDNSTPDPVCRLGPDQLPIKYRGAFAFALQTCSTGTPSSLF